jgi:hypothetical protein
MTSHSFTRKIGRNKGKPRLWLEGAILQDHGFTQGSRFDLIHTATGFTLELSSDGARKVSGKPDRPIIDITASSLGETVGQAAIVKIDATSRKLTVEVIA